MGLRTDKAIKESTRKAQADYAKIKKSGVASANEIKKAHIAMTEKIKRNHAEMRGGASKLTKVFNAIKGPLLAIVGITAGIRLIKSMTAAALENESQVRKLRTQVNLLGGSYDDQAESINNAIKATARYAMVQTGEVSEVLQQLIFVSQDVKKSQEALNLVYNLSFLKNMSVAESTQMVGRALSGNVETLGRYFVQFKNLNETLGKFSTLEDRAAYAIAFLSEVTKDAIKDMTEHEKKFKTARNNYETFTQKSGERLLFLFDGVYKLLDVTRKTTEALGVMGAQLQALGISWFYLAGIVKESNEELKNHEKTETASIETSEEVAERIKEKSDALEELVESQKKANKATKDAINDGKDYIKNLEARVIAAANFNKSLEEMIKNADRAEAKKGKTPEQALKTDLKFGEEDFKKAQEEFAAGNVEAGEALLKSALQAALAIRTTETDVSAGVKMQADRLESAIEQFAAQTKKAADNALKVEKPQKEREIKTLEENLKAGVEKLNGIKASLNEQIAKAEVLNQKLEKTIEKEINIHENYVTGTPEEIQTKKDGGIVTEPIKARTGTIIPGYGTVDKIPALLTKGEGVVQAASVRKLGTDTFNAYNAGDEMGVISALLKRFDLSALAARMPIERIQQVQKMQAGGMAGPPPQVSDKIAVDLSINGGESREFTTEKDGTKEFFENAKAAGIIYGRHKRPY